MPRCLTITSIAFGYSLATGPVNNSSIKSGNVIDGASSSSCLRKIFLAVTIVSSLETSDERIRIDRLFGLAGLPILLSVAAKVHLLNVKHYSYYRYVILKNSIDKLEYLRQECNNNCLEAQQVAMLDIEAPGAMKP